MPESPVTILLCRPQTPGMGWECDSGSGTHPFSKILLLRLGRQVFSQEEQPAKAGNLDSDLRKHQRMEWSPGGFPPLPGSSDQLAAQKSWQLKVLAGKASKGQGQR